MRTLPEILYKYSPDEDTRALLLSASEISVSADKQARALKIGAFFPELIKKNKLYRIES